MFENRAQWPVAAAVLRMAALVGLVVWTFPASSQKPPCSTATEALQKQLLGGSPARAQQAAQCVGENPAKFAGAFQNLIDVIRLPATPRRVAQPSIWAAGKIAEISRVDSSAAEVLARELITKVQDPKQPIEFRRACAYTIGRLSGSLPNAWETSGQTISSQSVGALASVLREREHFQVPEGYDRLLSAEYLGLLNAATDALGRFGSQAQSTLSEICDLLQDSVERLSPDGGAQKGSIHRRS